MINEWGPAILVCFTVIVGLVYQNKWIDDLSARVDKRLDDANSRLSDFRAHLDTRIGDLRDFLKSEIGRLEKRIEAFG